MPYETFVSHRNARVVNLLEQNPSVRQFIEGLYAKLTAHAENRDIPFERLVLDETYVVNVTGDEKIRARILRG